MFEIRTLITFVTTNTRPLNRKKLYFIFIFSIVSFFIAFITEKSLQRKEMNFEGICLEAEENIRKEEKRINVFLNDIQAKLKAQQGYTRIVSNYINSLTEKINGFTLFVFYNDSLRYWSDNSVLITAAEVNRVKNQESIQLKNGTYELFKKQAGDKLIVALLLIKYDYSIENKFLVNDFNEVLKLPAHTQISQIKNEKIFPVHSSKGNVLFSLSFSLFGSDESGNSFPGILYLISLFVLLIFFYLYIQYLFQEKPLLALLMILLAVGLRALMVMLRFPDAVYDLPLFSPKFYASSYMLNSLGDLLISSIIFCFIITSLYNYYEKREEILNESFNKVTASVRVVLTWLFTFLFSVLINYLLSSLIINSKISFNINNIFELTGYSIIGFLVIGILLFSFYLVCDGGIRFILKTNFPILHIGILFLITQGIFLVILINYRNTELFKDYGVSSFLLANLLIIFMGFIRHSSGRAFSFTRAILFILGFSVYAAYNIYEFNEAREKNTRTALAAKLENEQDKIAEYLFDEISSRMRTDSYIQSSLLSSYRQVVTGPVSGDALNNRIQLQYFSGYWEKFDIKIKAFNGDGLPFNTGGDPSWNLDRFEELIDINGRPTYSQGLYYINNESGGFSYLAKVIIPSLVSNDSIAGTLIIELDSKYMRDESGYPELLLSDKIPLKKDISAYSYARYRNKMLISQNGKYSYNLLSVFYDKYLNPLLSEQFVEFEGRSHLFYKTGKDGLIILSILTSDWLEPVTLFSYIFSLFTLIFIIIYVIAKLIRTKFRLFINFKTRIQFTVISIVITAMLLIGASTVYYIRNNYSNTQEVKVRERLNSMLINVSKDLINYNELQNTISDELASKFSNLYSSVSIDFNLYNKEGHLLYSTQPKIYEQNIIATTMNRFVFNQFNSSYRSNYIYYEHIGDLGFLSGYAVLRNYNNNVIGYLNLPYFARLSELKKEISSFLVALINIYVLLFAFSVVVTFIISNRITEPLRIIQERMSKVKLGKRNEQIRWKGVDEIGDLINEYNRMIDELSDSAFKLAKSERESAWREMAKQVAHEIKNPLTPMKLSVQHLQRAWKDKSTNVDELMQRFSQTLVEQIDTLSGIANEFSNFAQMPKANYEVLDLQGIVKSVVNLYQENDKVKIFLAENKGSFDVYADKDQMLRVFTNLIKNSIQAIPEKRKGVVELKLYKHDGKCVVSIKDNGQGIPEDKISKIFTPNFTTKTGGTGLGLAMVKNIVENSNGKIWFATESNIGTIFYVSLPDYGIDDHNS